MGLTNIKLISQASKGYTDRKGGDLFLKNNEIGVQTSTLRRWLVTASVVPSSPILVTLMKEALNSSEKCS
jgi:hypothetical protein